MSFALNEVEAMARKAARGTQYSWGMAEEAAKATRWLCAQGVDGCAELAGLLAVTDGLQKTELAPIAPEGDWHASAGQLCPLMAGSALSDFSFLLTQGEIRLRNVIRPGLLLPFVAVSARRLGKNLTLDVDGAQIVTNGRDVDLTDGTGWLNSQRAALVRVFCAGVLQRVASHHSRATPDPAVWGQLNDFAGRTYAPSTEQSRLLGAGAGLSDND